MTRFIIAQIPNPANQKVNLMRPCYPKSAILMAIFCVVMVVFGAYFVALIAFIFALNLFGYGKDETDEEHDADAQELSTGLATGTGKYGYLKSNLFDFRDAFYKLR